MHCQQLAANRFIRAGTACLLVVLLGSLGVRAEPRPKALRLLQRIKLPEAHSVATDIRWASDDSVYVSWDRNGVAEVGLNGTKQRGWVPDLKTLDGLNHYSHLAVSPSALITASENWGVLWRPRKANPDGKVVFHRQEIPLLQDFDLAGDKILLLGLAKRESPFAPRGEVAWVGALHGKVENLEPVLRDIGGPGAPNFYNCGNYQVGAVRFLADGTFVIAPGFQDGVHLFDAGGQRVRTWTNQQIGIDSHIGCSTMSAEEEKKLRLDDAFLQRWVNSRHILDDILPLPEGPGLLVRSWGTEGRAHWTLKVLRPRGIETYAVPVVGRRAFDRLHGDVRNGRIILLLSNSGFPYSKAPEDLPAEILLMELPNAREEGA